MSASIWNPQGNNIPTLNPAQQVKSQVFTAVEGQTDFVITQFTYALNSGAIEVFVNRTKIPQTELTELSESSFRIPACELGDLVEVSGNIAINDPSGAVASAVAAAAAAQASAADAALAETGAEASAVSAAASASAASGHETAAQAAAAIAQQYVPLNWRGDWLTATSYAINDAFKDSGNSYVVIADHISTTIGDDLTNGNIDLLAEKGAAGVGTGDMLGANNLSDVASASASRANLGLGSAATQPTSAFATAAQGTKADSALQPAAIGVSVQAYDADTAKLDVAQSWTAQQVPMSGALADGATIAWDGAANGQVVALTTTAARTFNAPTNIQQNALYLLRLTTGGFTPVWNAAYKWPAGGTPSSLVAGTYIFTFLGGAGNTLEPTGPGYLTGV